MATSIITPDDLRDFKNELFEELKSLIHENVQPAKKWLKTDEVKKLLKVSPGTLQTLRINGTLQYSKLGGIYYYDFDQIQKTLERNIRLAKDQAE